VLLDRLLVKTDAWAGLCKDAVRKVSEGGAQRALQANCRAHRPQKLKCSISLYTNPVSILSVPIQTVR
jgi:hypothetical protein